MKILIAGGLFLCLAAALPVRPGAGEPSPPPAETPTPAPRTQEVRGGFVRYIPDREGEYEWKMEGDSILSLSPVSLEITRLKATALSPRQEGLTIEAEKVFYFTDTGIVRNEESRVTVRRENSVLTGRGYLWTPANRQIRIFEDVRLLINEEGGAGLFPL